MIEYLLKYYQNIKEFVSEYYNNIQALIPDKYKDVLVRLLNSSSLQDVKTQLDKIK